MRFALILLSSLAAAGPAGAGPRTLVAAGAAADKLLHETEFIRTPVPEGGSLLVEDPFRQAIVLTAAAPARWETHAGGRGYVLRLSFGRSLEVRLSHTGRGQVREAEGALEISDPFGRPTTLKVDFAGTLLVERRWTRRARLLDRAGRVILEMRLPPGGRIRLL